MKKKSSKFKIFFTIFLVLDLIIMAAGLIWLWMNLDSYEKSQAIRGAEQAAQLFRDRDYNGILQKSELETGEFVSEAELQQYLEQKLKETEEIHCVKLKSSKNQAIYAIKSGNHTLAKAQLEQSENSDRFGRRCWELVGLQEVWQDASPYTICVPQKVHVQVNGRDLTENEKKDDTQIPLGYRGLGEDTQKPRQLVYEVSGLLQTPQVTADVGEKLCCEVEVDRENPHQIRVIVRPDETQTEKLSYDVMAAAKTYARFITQDAAFDELSRYLIKNSKFYDSVRTFYNGWYATHDSHRFEQEKIEEWMWYDETHLSCKASFVYTIQKGERTFEYPSAYEVFLIETPDGWKIADMVVL